MKKKSKSHIPLPPWTKAVAIYCTSIVLLLTVIFGVFSVAYAGKIYPRVTVADIIVGGLTKEAAKQRLEAELPKQKIEPVITTSQGQSFTIKPDEVGAQYDLNNSVDAAFQVGRGPDWLANLSQKIMSPIWGTDLPAKVSVANDKFEAAVKKISEKVTIVEKDADLKVSKGTVTIVPAVIGTAVNSDRLKQQILDAFGRHDRQSIELTIEKHEPKIFDEGAKDAKQQAEAIIAQPIILTYQDKTFTATPEIIGNWLSTKPVKAVLKTKLALVINEEQIGKYVASLAQALDVDPHDARLAMVNGQVNIIESSKDGLHLKQDSAKTDLIRLLTIRKELPAIAVVTPSNIPTTTPTAQPSAGASPALSPNVTSSPLLSPSPELAENQVGLEVEVRKPDVSNENINSLGIKERLAIAATDFRTSPANRQENIKLGTRLFNGIILKPGDQFSAVKSLGRIDESAGFKPELVIKEDQLRPEVGGGLCQVSTTLFRAVMNAGLQIDERRNHSERVSYYEVKPPNPDPEDYVTNTAKTLVGMDATIYDPSPDFKFRNDTGNYVLIQGRVDGTRLTFELYGTKDGRQTSIDGPAILSTTPAPTEILYLDDPTLPAGTTRVKEKAHDGAKTVFTYTVTKDGKQIHKSTFTSVYKAWQAKSYRGTGPAPSPSPSPAIETSPTAEVTPTP